VINAGSGNETLTAALSTGGNLYTVGSGKDEIDLGAGKDSVQAGFGQATINAGTGADLFTFTHIQNGTHGAEVINGFKANDVVNLSGYQQNEALNDLNNARIVNGSTIVTLSDNTMITFTGVTNLKPTNLTQS
jgi:Ca2+-binding RTX toxin-like protein